VTSRIMIQSPEASLAGLSRCVEFATAFTCGITELYMYIILITRTTLFRRIHVHISAQTPHWGSDFSVSLVACTKRLLP
jgi:hypothetical protein